MSVLQLENLVSGVVPIGTMMVVEGDGKTRPYNSVTDNLDSVIGVAFGTTNTSGRNFSIGNGTDYYNLDYYTWKDDMTLFYDGNDNLQENPNYASFNPNSDVVKYTTIITHGFAPVLIEYLALPSRWIVINEKTTHDWVLIR